MERNSLIMEFKDLEGDRAGSKLLETTDHHIYRRSKGSTVRFYRLRSNVNPLLGSAITRSKVLASTLIRSTILRPTPNLFWNN